MKFKIKDIIQDDCNNQQSSGVSQNDVKLNLVIKFVCQGDILNSKEIEEIFVDLNKAIPNIESLMRKNHSSLRLSLSKFFIESMGGSMAVQRQHKNGQLLTSYNIFLKDCQHSISQLSSQESGTEKRIGFRESQKKERENYVFMSKTDNDFWLVTD